MIVSIHQPEHFPYLGFFQKMSASQLFVILDDVKFKKNDFQNRNRFINKCGNEEWFTVPVEKHSNSKLIKDVIVGKDLHWKSKIQKQINLNLKHDVSDIYEISDRLIDINMASIKWCMKKLNIETKLVMSSELEKDGKKSELLLSICKSLGATKYISGQGGHDYLDVEIFKQANIDVDFFKVEVPNMMSTLYNLRL